MIAAIKSFIRYRVGQKLGRKAARTLGLGSLAGVIGVVAGMKAMRRG